MGDRLDKLTGELIAMAMQRAEAPSEAVAAQRTAGFAILIRADGEQAASKTLRQIVDKLVARVINQSGASLPGGATDPPARAALVWQRFTVNAARWSS